MKTSSSTTRGLVLSTALLWLGSSDAFGVRPAALQLVRSTQQQSNSCSALSAAGGGKGFGETPEPPPPKKQKEATVEATTQAVAAPAPAPAPPRPQNEGQKALADMRRQRAEQKDDELRKVRDMLAADKQIEQAPAVIPERVAQRMGKRMLPFVGIPLIGGMGSFVTFWYLATYKNYEFQPAMVAFSTIAILAVSLVGITYSVMSASWDEDREGDMAGTDEFQKNFQNIREGLQRSRENALLRDNVASFGTGELEKALTDLDKREVKAQPKSLEDKLNVDN